MSRRVWCITGALLALIGAGSAQAVQVTPAALTLPAGAGVMMVEVRADTPGRVVRVEIAGAPRVRLEAGTPVCTRFGPGRECTLALGVQPPGDATARPDPGQLRVITDQGERVVALRPAPAHLAAAADRPRALAWVMLVLCALGALGFAALLAVGLRAEQQRAMAAGVLGATLAGVGLGVMWVLMVGGWWSLLGSLIPAVAAGLATAGIAGIEHYQWTRADARRRADAEARARSAPTPATPSAAAATIAAPETASDAAEDAAEVTPQVRRSPGRPLRAHLAGRAADSECPPGDGAQSGPAAGSSSSR